MTSLMISSCCTFLLKRRRAFSRDSPSCNLTSATNYTPKLVLFGPVSYCKISTSKSSINLQLPASHAFPGTPSGSAAAAKALWLSSSDSRSRRAGFWTANRLITGGLHWRRKLRFGSSCRTCSSAESLCARHHRGASAGCGSFIMGIDRRTNDPRLQRNLAHHTGILLRG